MGRQLVDAGPEDGAQDIVEPLHRPIRRQHRGDQIVELDAIGGDPAHQLAEPWPVDRAGIELVDDLVQPVRLELADDVVGLAAAELDLIERLHRRQPGGAALAAAGGPAPGIGAVLGGHAAQLHSPAIRRLSAIIARQALAASPPLSLRSTLARAQACSSFSTVRMP